MYISRKKTNKEKISQETKINVRNFSTKTEMDSPRSGVASRMHNPNVIESDGLTKSKKKKHTVDIQEAYQDVRITNCKKVAFDFNNENGLPISVFLDTVKDTEILFSDGTVNYIELKRCRGVTITFKDQTVDTAFIEESDSIKIKFKGLSSYDNCMMLSILDKSQREGVTFTREENSTKGKFRSKKSKLQFHPNILINLSENTISTIKGICNEKIFEVLAKNPENAVKMLDKSMLDESDAGDVSKALKELHNESKTRKVKEKLALMVRYTKAQKPKANISVACIEFLPSAYIQERLEEYGVNETKINYLEDPFFRHICKHKDPNKAVLGITKEKGGLLTVLDVAIIGAVTRYISQDLGEPETCKSFKEVLAGSHGPYFIFFTKPVKGLNRLGACFDISDTQISVILVPDQDSVKLFKHALEVCKKLSIIDQLEVNAIYKKVLTYEQAAKSKSLCTKIYR